MRPLPRNGITVLLSGLEERFCEFVVREFPLGGDMANYVSTDSEARAELAGGFVFAGGAARLAVHEAVFADAHVDDGLAKNTELFALAGVLGLLALCALEFRAACSGAHAANLSRLESEGKMTLVMARRRKSGRAGAAYFRCAL
jgi:hypothetical protein